MKPSRATVIALTLLALAPCGRAQSCAASATTVAFGTYDPFAPLPRDSTGSVSVNCAAHATALNLAYSVSLAAGGSGNVAARTLTSGVHRLNYQLYTDPMRMVPWGDAAGGTSKVFGLLLLNLVLPVSDTHTVYGRIAAGQTGVGAGSYTDTITVTVSY
ncbi:MAG TPA: spore coat U domain-containing protein [Burkholderiaceae bacterium]|nr:spore coat U domain-containing protein [Burkholderiaceae bacterium]